MAYDDGHAELMRQELVDEPGLSEKKMFGGLCFLKDGNMIVAPLSFTGRKMGGMVDVSEDVLADDIRRRQIFRMALDYARSLPSKA